MPVRTSNNAGQRWLLPVVLVAAVLAVGVGLGIRELSNRQPETQVASVLPPETSSRNPANRPGPDTVQLTADAAGHPHAEEIRELLQRHFSAINRGDYEVWKTTVVSARVQEMPPSKWRAEYESTQDGSIYVHRVDTTSGGALRVMLSLVSVQSPNKAPPELRADCIVWHVVYPLVQDSGNWKINHGLYNSSRNARC
ncbi:hypothetical protein [Allokutzneria oryzae]|uniref:SnoaL-like domain-containing protein n=1 Tax=Allokutzneria oryzae TaxID=1378989 RepID=A0ABV6AB43_9PSEU